MKNNNNNKHTPGPWKYRDGFVRDGNGKSLAMMVTGSIPKIRSGEETEANARLIAAAPDLLEALEKIVEMNPEPNSSASHIYLYSHSVELARAAIAKAKGG